MTTTSQTANAAAPATVSRMARAARAFLESLTESQRGTANLPFEGDERYEWNYTPVDRNGLRALDMQPEQLELAYRLMETAYSERGAKTAHEIIQLETVLGEWEEMTKETSRWERAEHRYWWTVFGEPGGDQPWGFRVGGHHIGLSITVANGDRVSVLPLFFGANPAEVRHGAQKGHRTLAAEEDMPRKLLSMLSPEQKKIAIVDAVAPADILTRNYRSADPDAVPVGIPFGKLQDAQRDVLTGLVRHYVTRASDELSANYWRRVEAQGFDALTFAWAGPEQKGHGHYYAVKSPMFMIEYDNTQNGANHIHSVLRDFTHDFGEDLLAAHYAESHGG